MGFSALHNGTNITYPWPTDHCDPILLQLATNESIYQTVPLGLCPDFVTVIIISVLALTLQVGLALLTIVCSICRRNVEPVKSRSAFVISISTIMQTILCIVLCIRLFIGRAVYPCSLYTLLIFEASSLVILPYIIKLYRLFIIMRINELKTRYSKLEKEFEKFPDEQTSTMETLPQDIKTPESTAIHETYFSIEVHHSLKKQISILKFLITPAMLLLPVSIFVFIFASIWFALGSFELLIPTSIIVDRGFSMNITIGCSVSFLGVVFVGFIILFHVAILLVVCLINCKTKDTLFIKYEVVVMLIVYSAAGISYMVLGVIPFVSKLIDYFAPYGMILVYCVTVDTLVSGLIPILISFKPKTTDRLKKQSNEVIETGLADLRRVLQNSNTRAMLLSYAKRSFCPEAVLCWQEIYKFKNAKTKKKKMDVFEHIVNTFLETNSPLELNLPLESRQEYTDLFKQELSKQPIITKRKSVFDTSTLLTDNSLSADILDGLMKKCEFNLVDIYQRFKDVPVMKKEISKILK